MRALLGEVNFSRDFGPDEKLGPFSVNGVAPISEPQVQDYGAEAQHLAGALMDDPMHVLPCDPATGGEQACGAAFVQEFLGRAFRRPPPEEQLQAYVTAFEAERVRSGFPSGVALVVEAALQSPSFLYHQEVRREGEARDKVAWMDGYSVAEKLSYALTAGPADGILMAEARADRLQTQTQILEQAMRLMATAGATEQMVAFYEELLEMEKLSQVAVDGELGFTEAIRTGFEDELHAYVAHVLGPEGEGTLSALLLGDHAFVNGSTAPIYGIEGVTGDEMQQVAAPEDRMGILTLPGVLTANRGPVRRGKTVREHLLCQPIAPPPPGVSTTPPEPPEGQSLSPRQQWELHTTDATCASCHSLMDPLGFPLDTYDPLGRYRTHYGDDDAFEVDTAGEISGTVDVDGPVVGAKELIETLASSKDVAQCAVRQWMVFTYNQEVNIRDHSCVVDRLYGTFADRNFDLRSLIVDLVTQESFRQVPAESCLGGVP